MIFTGILDRLNDWRAAGTAAEVPDYGSEDGALRALPREEVFVYMKHFENSRVVRVVDRGDKAMSVSFATFVPLLALLVIVLLMPGGMNLMASRRIATLRAEREVLLDRLNVARARNAELRDPQRLKDWGRGRYAPPAANEVVFGAPQPGDSQVAGLKER